MSKAKKLGRPKLIEGEHQDEQIFARVTLTQKEIFEAGCHLEGLSPSAILRQFVMNKNLEWEQKYGEKLAESVKLRRRRKKQSSP